MVRLKNLLKKIIMGKFYENLDTLNGLVAKLDKKNNVSYFILKCIEYAKDHPELTAHQIIKDMKKEYG
jgi:hypothetical protein